MKNAGVSYGEKPVFKNLNWTIRKGSRTAIVGVNGAGKTTLLKMLAGSIPASTGEIKAGHEVKIGYYAQLQAETLDPQKTILQELEMVAPDMAISQVRGIAGAFLFSGDAVEKRCGVLSGGEKARVALAKLLLAPSNFLVLDEPTNHLDVESRGVLLDALQEYSGTLCLVSHDRGFISPLVDSVLEIAPNPQGSEVIQLVGGYEDYLRKKMQEAAQSLSRSAPAKTAAQAAPKIEEKLKVSAPSNNQKKAWVKERAELEVKISTLETEQGEVVTLIADPATYADKTKTLALLDRQKKLDKDLAWSMARWEELCLLLDRG